MKPTLVFLQNAWSPLYSGYYWPRRSWLPALEDSRSGQRLVHLIDDLDVCWNVSPITGYRPDSIIRPDDDYVRTILACFKHSDQGVEQVVACGKYAEECLRRVWNGPLLAVPHPASRLLPNKLYHAARRRLEAGLEGQAALRLSTSRKGYRVELLGAQKQPIAKEKAPALAGAVA